MESRLSRSCGIVAIVFVEVVVTVVDGIGVDADRFGVDTDLLRKLDRGRASSRLAWSPPTEVANGVGVRFPKPASRILEP